MSISDRLKLIRGVDKQEDFAKALKVNKNTIGRWERGEQTPDVDDLNRILEMYPDINPTWLLTGEGYFRRGETLFLEPTLTPGDSMAEKFKMIRGDMPMDEFCKKFARLEEDRKRWVGELQAIEEDRKQPDWVLISCVCHVLGISPSWIIEDEGPMLKSEISPQMLDFDVLEQIIIAVIKFQRESDDEEYNLLVDALARQTASNILNIYKSCMNMPTIPVEKIISKFKEALTNLGGKILNTPQA